MKYYTLLIILISVFACSKQTANLTTTIVKIDTSYINMIDSIDILSKEKNCYDEYIVNNFGNDDSLDIVNMLRTKYYHISNLNSKKMYQDAYEVALKTISQINDLEHFNYTNGLVKAIYDEMNFAIQMDDSIYRIDNTSLIYNSITKDDFIGTISKDSILSLIDKMDSPTNIDIVINDDVLSKIELFLTKYKKTLITWNENKTIYDEKITPILLSYNIPHEVIYIAMIESGYKYSAISRTKAVGMWQFMPQTAKGLGANINYWEDDRKDFIKATHLAANFLSSLHDKYNNWLLSFAAYNCGGGRVDKLLEKHRGRSVWDIYNYLPEETRNYVTSYLAVTLLSENLHNIGIDIQPKNSLKYKTAVVEGGILLSFIAHCADTSTNAIKTLNPQFSLGSTPTNQNEVIVKIPTSKYDLFVENYQNKKKSGKKTKIIVVTHTIRSGDSLYKLARIYKTTVDKILSANTIKNSKKIKPGMKIVIPVPVSAIQ